MTLLHAFAGLALSLSATASTSCTTFRNTSNYYFQDGPPQRASAFFNCTDSFAMQTVVGTDCDTSNVLDGKPTCQFFWGDVVHGNSSNNASLSTAQAAPLYDLVRSANKPPGRQTFPAELSYAVISGPEVHLGYFSTCLRVGQKGYQIFTPKQMCINGTLSGCDASGPVLDNTYINLCGVGTVAGGARVDGQFSFVPTDEGTSFPGGNDATI